MWLLQPSFRVLTAVQETGLERLILSWAAPRTLEEAGNRGRLSKLQLCWADPSPDGSSFSQTVTPFLQGEEVPLILAVRLFNELVWHPGLIHHQTTLDQHSCSLLFSTPGQWDYVCLCVVVCIYTFLLFCVHLLFLHWPLPPHIHHPYSFVSSSVLCMPVVMFSFPLHCSRPHISVLWDC